MTKKRNKKLLSMLLALVMLLGMLPLSAMAAEEKGAAERYTVRYDSAGGSAVKGP